MMLPTWGFPRPSQPNFPCCTLRATLLTGLSQGQTSTSSNVSSPTNRPADLAIPSLCHLVEDWSSRSAFYGGKKKKKLILATSDPEQGTPTVHLCEAGLPLLCSPHPRMLPCVRGVSQAPQPSFHQSTASSPHQWILLTAHST